jgi:hypothetical protein
MTIRAFAPHIGIPPTATSLVWGIRVARQAPMAEKEENHEGVKDDQASDLR